MKSLSFFLLLVGCVVGCVIEVSVAAEDLGRLFTSSQERKVLDDLRQIQKSGAADPETPVPELPTEISSILPSDIKLSGLLQRADGQYVIWVNGKSDLSNADLPLKHAHFSSDTPNVTLQTNQQQATLKPGQVWRLNDNVVFEGYLSGREIVLEQE